MPLSPANRKTRMQHPEEKEILLPDEILINYLSAEEIAAYKAGSSRIKSITVYAEKTGI